MYALLVSSQILASELFIAVPTNTELKKKKIISQD